MLPFNKLHCINEKAFTVIVGENYVIEQQISDTNAGK
jgi:hypothetical protein